MEFITHLQERLTGFLGEVIEGYEGEINATSLAELEVAVKQMEQEFGKLVIEKMLEAQEPAYASLEERCPYCGGEAEYQRWREGTVITLQGRVRYRRRYYLCSECGQGHYPVDEELGIKPGQMSEEVVKEAALLGVQDAFGTARDVLRRLTGLELSANSIRKATQIVGERVVEREEAQVALSEEMEHQLAQRRAPAPKRLYGSMDGFMTLFKDGWHEMKAGAWWTVDERGRAQNIQYYVDTVAAEHFSDLVWATGDRLNAAQAEELVFITDGADWIRRIIAEHYPQAVHIIDIYHASGYLETVAQAAIKNEARRDAWLKQARTALWEGRIDEVIGLCEQYRQAQLKPEDDPAYAAVRYFTNHRHQMDYPSYRAQGYQIGSGTMESGCKQIGLARLKIAGVRWSKAGARLVAKARAAYLSGRWDEVCSPAA